MPNEGQSRDHPRVCGEKRELLQGVKAQKGSPPRVRGKVMYLPPKTSSSGITPACAGKRGKIKCKKLAQWDHPRVCGEKTGCCRKAIRSRGSPPRVRGKAPQDIDHAQRIRITPACAGKSWTVSAYKDAYRDHPRVCGEKAALKDPIPARLGSPPRVRGKVLAALMPENRVGITPACAGKRGSQHCKQQPDRDHPRVCGEKVGGISARSCCTGSPPRVRGKVFKYVAYLNGFRITPACAGKSSGAFSPGFQT